MTELHMMTWPNICEMKIEHGEKFVTKLKCKVCSIYKEKLKNFNYKWISEGADSIWATNFRDHTKSDKHVHTMNLHRK